jgi:drug/metabolite transporter (DMT)-like permease
MASRRNIYLMLVLVMLIWSGNSILGRAMRMDVPPLTMAFLRWGGAALIAVPLAWRHIRADRGAIRQGWPIILLLGIVGVGSFNALMYSGLQYTTAANSLLIQAGIPALVLLFDFLFFRVMPRWAQVAGCLLASSGVAIIVFRGDPAALATLAFNRGDALMLCAVTMWSIYTVLLRLRPRIDSLSFLALTIVIGALVMAPFSAVELQTRDVHLSLSVMAGLAYLITLPSIVGYFLFNKAVETIGAGDAGQVTNLQPLFGAILASLILGEPFDGHHLIGMVLIFAGIGLPFISRPKTL